MITHLSEHATVQLVRHNVRNFSADGELFTDQIKLRNACKEVQGVSVKSNTLLSN